MQKPRPLLLALCVLASAAIGAAGQPLAVNDPANTTAPVVRLTAPADNAELSLRTREVEAGGQRRVRKREPATFVIPGSIDSDSLRNA